MRDALIWSVEEAGSGDFGGKPVGFGKADDEGNEVLFDVFGFELGADLVEGFDSLSMVESDNTSTTECFFAYLVSHKRLFNGCEVL